MTMRTFLKKIVSRSLFELRNMLGSRCRFREVAVLAYHSIGNADTETAIPEASFEEQLLLLKKQGSSFVSLSDIVAWRKGSGVLPRHAVAITFDDGYADFETVALPILKRLEIPVTLFMVGDPEASRKTFHNTILVLSPEALARVQASPLVSVEYHSLTHSNLSTLHGDDLKRECQSTFPSRFFAYPGGNHSAEAVAVIQDLGYEAAFGISWNLTTKTSDLFILPRSVVTRAMRPWEVVYRTTQALVWYKKISGAVS
jgi:peptidoglycan/xylan/chitin deacetylase (PgdA/CDA1 family)